jgi:DNA-directed RNA polymerase subunit RPC12/RpoP
MQKSKCAECGKSFETAVTLTNVVCVRCMATLYDWGEFEDDQPTRPRDITPLRAEDYG